MIGSIISGAAGIASGIFGGIKAGKARKQAQASLDQEKAFNENLFNKEYYADAMERSDNVSLMKNMRDMLTQQNKQAQATAVITGGTAEAAAAQKEAANGVLAQSASNIAASNSSYKDNVMNRYLGQRRSLFNQQQDMYNKSAESWSNMMKNGLSAATSAGGGILSELG